MAVKSAGDFVARDTDGKQQSDTNDTPVLDSICENLQRSTPVVSDRNREWRVVAAQSCGSRHGATRRFGTGIHDPLVTFVPRAANDRYAPDISR
jgi:hypothetical protein